MRRVSSWIMDNEFPPTCDCCKKARVFLTSVPYLVQDKFFQQKFKRQNESDFCQRAMVIINFYILLKNIFLEWPRANQHLISNPGIFSQMTQTFS